LYTSQGTKSVTGMGKGRNEYRVLVEEILKERDYCEDADVDVEVIFK